VRCVAIFLQVSATSRRAHAPSRLQRGLKAESSNAGEHQQQLSSLAGKEQLCLLAVVAAAGIVVPVQDISSFPWTMLKKQLPQLHASCLVVTVVFVLVHVPSNVSLSRMAQR